VKLLETARKTVQKAAAAVGGAVAAMSPKKPRDPFNFDDERKAEINARGLHRWLGPRRKGWLR
jgi:hypothetical protein